MTLSMARRLLREIGIKSCREVRFSNGGAFFAAANNAAVQVYSSYTAENVGYLRRVQCPDRVTKCIQPG